MSNTDLQIACLEAALEAAYRLRSAPVSAPAAAPSGLGAEQVERREAQSATGAPGLLSRLNPFNRDEDETAEASAPDAAGASGLGAEQVNYRRGSTRDIPQTSRGRLDSAVASFRSLPYQRLEVTLENGQVWRQIRGDSQDVVDRMRQSQTYSVTISESQFGGYELRIHDMARTIRVERIR